MTSSEDLVRRAREHHRWWLAKERELNSKHVPECLWEKEKAMNDPGDENDSKVVKRVHVPGRIPVSFPIDEGRQMRQFETGATRNRDEDAYDYEGFLSPIVLQRFAAYMHRHREQSDGTVRDSDNWQRGIPVDSYAKSLNRHHMDAWLHHRGFEDDAREELENALCAILFNSMGWLHEILVGRGD